MKSTKNILHSFQILLLLCVILAVPPGAFAGNGTDTWTGLAGDNAWATAGNWTGANAPPINGDTPAFLSKGSGGLTLNNNIAGGSYNGLTFDAGAPSFVLDGDAITNNGTITDNSTSSETINFGLDFPLPQNIAVAAGGTLTINGVISDVGGITTTGPGTVSLTTNSSFSGGTTLNNGTLILDFSTLGINSGGTISNNIINPLSALTFGGGSLVLNESQTLTNTQTFAGTEFTNGNATVTINGTGTNFATLDLGALAQTLGATVVFNGVATIGAGGVNVPGVGIITTSSAGTGPSGLIEGPSSLSGYATVGAYDWAAVTGTGQIVGGSQIASFYTQYASANNAIAGNADIIGSSGSHNTDSGVSMRFNTPGAITFNLTSIVDGAGLLVTPNVGPNNITLTANSGESYEGDRSGNNRAWVFWQNNTNGLLICDAQITDTKSSTDASVQAGPGTVVYESTVQPSYSLSTYLNGGVSEIYSDTALGTATLASTIELNGGTVLGAVSFSMDVSGADKRPFALGTNGGGLAAVSNTVFTVDGVISGSAGTGPLFIGIPASSANGNVLGLVPGTGPNTANVATNASGIVVLTGTNTYTGGTVLYSGVLNFNSNSLGVGGITFDGGTLQWASGSAFDISSQTITVGPAGGTLDLNGNNLTLLNSIGNLGSGGLTVTNGTLTLGAANTYSGGTTIATGSTLIAQAASGSATGTGPVTIESGATLEGSGSLSGEVTNLEGGVISPTGSLLSVGSLTLEAGSINDVQFSTGNSLIGVANSGGLALNGGAFKLLSGASPFASPGTYDLIQYTGSIGGSGLDSTWTAASDANPHVANPQVGYIYSFGTSGGYLTVTIGLDLSAVISTWTNNANGNWSTPANWSPNRVPHAPGDSATFGASTSLRTVTLDSDETIGGLAMTNPNSFVITGAGTVLTIDNSGFAASVNVTAGTANAIQTAVSLNSSAEISVASGGKLAISGMVSNETDPESVVLDGAGTVALSGNNSYGPSSGAVGTTLSGGGTLQVGNNNALGAGDLSVTGDSTLQAGASVTLPNNVGIETAVNATVDTDGNALSLPGTITGSGDITKIGAGTLTLGGNNASTFTGSATIDAGTLSISSDSNLGADVPLLINGGDLSGNGDFEITRNINIGLSVGSLGTNAFIDAAGGASVFQIGGNIASAGNTGLDNLIVNGDGGAGIVELLGAGTYGGTTVVAGGTLDVANSQALGNSTLNYNNQGGIVTFDGSIAAATFGGLAGGQSLPLVNTATAPVALTVGANSFNTVYSGSLSDAGAGGSLVKVGNGTLTLAGNNNYTGTTTVNGGTLEIPTNSVLSCGTLNGAGYLVDGGFLTNASTDVNLLATEGNAFLQTAGTVNIGEITQPNTDGMLVEVTGGTFICPNIDLLRDNDYATAPTTTAPVAALTTIGFYVNSTNTASPAQVYLGQMTIAGSGANSSSSFRLDAGSVTVTNEVLIGDQETTGRWSVMQINGGNFTNLDTVNGIVLSDNQSYQNDSELYLSGGNTYAQLINFGTAADSFLGLGDLIITNATLYVGSGGVNSPSTAGYTSTIWLETGVLGALADWSSAISGDGATFGWLLGIPGDNFTIQAADPANNPHNISLTGSLGGPGNLVKTGGGTLMLGGLNSWTGTTTVSAGTLALAGDGVTTGVPLDTAAINIVSPGVVSVAGLTNGTLHLGDTPLNEPAQMLTGNGTVSGNVFIGAAGTLAPGISTSNFGNLTIAGNLTNSGALVLKVDHPGSGVTNDTVTAQTITNLLGATLTVTQGSNALHTGDVFHLFNIAGGNNPTNLTISLPATTPDTTITYAWNTNNLASSGTIVLTTGASAVNTNSTNIVFSVSAGVLHLSWPGNQLGWDLQTNSAGLANTNAWFTYPGSTAVTNENITIPSNGNTFFRLHYSN